MSRSKPKTKHGPTPGAMRPGSSRYSLARCLMVLVLSITAASGQGLLFKDKDGAVVLEITPDGDLLSPSPVRENSLSTGNPADEGDLVLVHGGKDRMALGGGEARFYEGVAYNSLGTTTAGLDIDYDSPEDDDEDDLVELHFPEAPDVSGKGAYLKGIPRGRPLGTLVKSVTYMDGIGVYEQNGATEPCKLAYANISSPVGGVEGRTDFSTDAVGHYFYVKDHLGSTRLVVDDHMEPVEATSYLAYGAMIEPPQAPEGSVDPAREKFTGKELDTEGTTNGAAGINAYHFGARMYDPEIGVWMRPDPAEQFFNGYAYTSANPINAIDPNGEFAGAILSASLWYINNAASYGSLNPGKWDWDDPMLIFSTVTMGFNAALDVAMYVAPKVQHYRAAEAKRMSKVRADIQAVSGRKDYSRLTMTGGGEELALEMGGGVQVAAAGKPFSKTFSHAGSWLGDPNLPQAIRNQNLRGRSEFMLRSFQAMLVGIGAPIAISYVGPVALQRLIMPSAKFAMQHQATIVKFGKAIGEGLLPPAPFFIHKNLPSLAAGLAIEGGMYITGMLVDAMTSTPRNIAPSPYCVPDNTGVNIRAPY